MKNILVDCGIQKLNKCHNKLVITMKMRTNKIYYLNLMEMMNGGELSKKRNLRLRNRRQVPTSHNSNRGHFYFYEIIMVHTYLKTYLKSWLYFHFPKACANNIIENS